MKFGLTDLAKKLVKVENDKKQNVKNEIDKVLIQCELVAKEKADKERVAKNWQDFIDNKLT